MKLQTQFISQIYLWEIEERNKHAQLQSNESNSSQSSPPSTSPLNHTSITITLFPIPTKTVKFLQILFLSPLFIHHCSLNPIHFLYHISDSWIPIRITIKSQFHHLQHFPLPTKIQTVRFAFSFFHKSQHL